jgi:hypothetical protein
LMAVAFMAHQENRRRPASPAAHSANGGYPPKIQPPAGRRTARRTRRLHGDRGHRARPGLRERDHGPGRRPGTDVRMTPAEIKGSDPGKLIIRLENRLSGLESLRSRSLTEIDQLTTEAAHAPTTSPAPSRKPASSPPPATASSGWRRSSGRQQRPRRTTAMTGCSQRPCPTQQPWQGFLVRRPSWPATRTASRNPLPRSRSVTSCG